MGEWTVREPMALEIDEPFESVDVRLVSGRVDVVAGDGGEGRVEIVETEGPPLRVRVADGRLTIAHEDVSWTSLLQWRPLAHERRRAVVAVAVPRQCAVSVGVVTADAVVAGVQGEVRVRCVDGDVTLDGTDGPVQVQSVSGDVELRDVTGDVNLKTVSGGLTVVAGHIADVRAVSVSGDVTLDLQPVSPPRIDVKTVSGELTVRVPEATGLDVDVVSASGDVVSAFDGVERSRRPGAQLLRGRVGDGAGRLRGRSVSGGVSLLASG